MLLDNILPNALSIFAAPICFYHRLKHPQMVSFGLYASLKKMCKNKIIGEIDSIWDIGANKGQFAFMAHQVWSNLPIYSFEPDPVTFKMLSDNFERFSIKGKVFPYALSDKVETKELKQYKDSVNNSMLQHNASINTVVGNVNVNCTTLDAVSATLPVVSRAFLKLDVQGFELIVISGAKKFLSRCEFVQIEVSFASTYKGGAHAGEIIITMHELGFECIEVMDLLRDKNQQNRITEADLLFKKIKHKT